MARVVLVGVKRMVHGSRGEGSGKTAPSGSSVGLGATSGNTNHLGESDIDWSNWSNRWQTGWGTGIHCGNCDANGASDTGEIKLEYFRSYY